MLNFINNDGLVCDYIFSFVSDIDIQVQVNDKILNANCLGMHILHGRLA